MIVAENDVFDVGKINAQLFGVFQHGVRSRSGVEQNPLPVRLDDGREAPFADAAVGIARKHGRKHFDSERSDGLRSLLLGLSVFGARRAVNTIRLYWPRDSRRQDERNQTMLHRIRLALGYVGIRMNSLWR